GERRFIVLQKNEVTEIPVRIYPNDISELEIKSIELAENMFRKEMTCEEMDCLIKDITSIQQQIHGAKPHGPGGEGWSSKDTASMLGISDASVSLAIKRAEAREIFPELFEGCKTQKDATNVLKKIDEVFVKDAIARKLEEDKQENVFTKISRSYIINDFFKGVKEIPDGVFHLVEIDPPYGIDLNKKKKSEGESQYMTNDYNEVPATDYQVFLANTFKECYRVMQEHSWLICWFGMHPWFETIYSELHNAGFQSIKLCGIWIKRSGQAMQPNIYLANSYETFFYAWKGRPALNKAGRSNIFDFPPVNHTQKIHPTERPVELMQEIYNTFAFPGSRVLIPFLGSGNGIIAANNLGMSVVGFELSKSYRDSFLVKLHNNLTK
ncbi:MAG: hypothetical protein KKD77_21380, partial [Gammaproteobacteria bacterium]|nr:hypothetical protein [Gammaproteobacteria bacterium]